VSGEPTHFSVMRELGSRIHLFSIGSFVLMDCRLKHGNDDGVVA
jgi:hypothetical protein